MRPITPYNPELKKLARELRNNSTKTEVLLWLELKNGKMPGYDFHRQKPLYEYIVDFFCRDLMLAIEIDGISHIGKNSEDKKRQTDVEEAGIRFLRFSGDDVFYRMDDVLKEIRRWINEYKETAG